MTEIVLQGATPLFLAAEVNNLDVIKALVEAEADPLIANERGTTPLMMAAGRRHGRAKGTRSAEERATALETAKFLVEHGADVNQAGQYGWTALHAASYQGMNDVIEYLVSKGAKIDQKDEFGQTPLSISLSVLTKDIGARRLQIPRRYRPEDSAASAQIGRHPAQRLRGRGRPSAQRQRSRWAYAEVKTALRVFLDNGLHPLKDAGHWFLVNRDLDRSEICGQPAGDESAAPHDEGRGDKGDRSRGDSLLRVP